MKIKGKWELHTFITEEAYQILRTLAYYKNKKFGEVIDEAITKLGKKNEK